MKMKDQKIYPLTDKYRIRTDQYNLMLEYKAKNTWTVLGYYSRLKSLVAKLYELEIKQNIDDLEYMIKLQEELIEATKDLQFK